MIDDLVTDANTVRPIVAGGTAASTASGARTSLGVVIGTDVQAYDAGLASIAGLTTAADRMIYTTASDTYAVATLTAAGRALIDDADAAAQLVTIGAQALDADLTALAALGSTGIAVRTASDTWAQRTITSADSSITITNPGGVAGNIDLSAGRWTFLATQTTASGTDKDFTGIPATAREIIIFFRGNSVTGTDNIWVRLGDAGGFEITGYDQATTLPTSAGDAGATAFAVYVGSAAGVVYGTMTLTLTDAAAFTWSQSHTTAHTTTRGAFGGGTKSLSDTLTQVRVTVSAGAWDAGSLAVGYR